MANYRNVSTDQVKAKQESGEPFRLIDVREADEHATAQIAGAELLPLSEARAWLGTLSPDDELVIFCHHGGRSAQVVNYLAQQGYTNVSNMVGGIEEWSLRIDPSVPRY